MPVTADRCKETTTTASTGTVTLAGAVSGFVTFQSVFPVGSVISYYIAGQGTTEWEVGEGTLVTTTTLSRDRVRASSNSGNLVSFSAGTKDVAATATANSIKNSNIARFLVHSRGWAMP